MATKKKPSDFKALMLWYRYKSDALKAATALQRAYNLKA